MPDSKQRTEEIAEDLVNPSRRRQWFGENRRVAWLLSFAMVALLVALATATTTMYQIAEDTDWVEHTLKVSATTQKVAALNEQVETGRRGYFIDPGRGFRTIITDANDALDEQLGQLDGLVADNPLQVARLNHINRLHDERRALVRRMFEAGPTELELLDDGAFNRERGVQIVREIRATALDMAETEATLLSQRNQSQLSALYRFYVVGGASIALLLTVLGAVIYTVWRFNLSLSAAHLALERSNADLEIAVRRRTGELQRANEEIQRFAYIVSHDLRSPLVNVLGFTSELDQAREVMQRYVTKIAEEHPELKDENVRLAVEEDLPEALGFIRNSTEKMDRLINSILELSRQGRRKLDPKPIDLPVLVESVVDNLHQRAADAGATVTIGSLPVVETDEIALEQILSNLVENAIKYLSPDRPGEITIEGRRFRNNVEIDVIDNGRGIAPEDHQRIFDLFRRSGKQDQAGEGIGLANVRALAYRLRGTINVKSELDQGARFRLSLPASLPRTEET